jgi:hypothetical protein
MICLIADCKMMFYCYNKNNKNTAQRHNIKNIFLAAYKNTLICLVGVTLPATPAVRKQKSIAFSTQKSQKHATSGDKQR